MKQTRYLRKTNNLSFIFSMDCGIICLLQGVCTYPKLSLICCLLFFYLKLAGIKKYPKLFIHYLIFFQILNPNANKVKRSCYEVMWGRANSFAFEKCTDQIAVSYSLEMLYKNHRIVQKGVVL